MPDKGFRLARREEAAEAIRRMSEEDLLYLNRLIVERLKLVSQARSTVLMARFIVGERVGFRAPTGEWKRGVIQRLNKKTVSLLTDDGRAWNVSPGFLSRDVEASERG